MSINLDDLISSKLLQFSLNEYHWGEYGADRSDIISNFAKFINVNDQIFKDLNIFGNDDNLVKFKDFINKSVELSEIASLSTRPATQQACETDFGKMNVILTTPGTYYLPIAKASNDITKIDKNHSSGHAIGVVIHTITPNNNYQVFILNSGYAVDYHNTQIDYTIKDDAIVKKTVTNSNVMHYFLYFLIMSSEIDQFYNTAVSILMQNDINICTEAGCNDYISKPIVKDKLFLAIDKYLG